MILPAYDAVTNSSPANPSLPAIAARAQLGDRDALEELLRCLQPQLGEHIRGIVLDDDLASDVLQDTLFIVCRRLGTVRDTDWVRAWAYRISTREAYRALRRSRHLQEETLDDVNELQDPSDRESGIADEELLSQLPARLASLPAAAQIVLRMHYLQSLTQQEVAEALEIPIGTVKSRLAYGLTFLRRVWTS
jgi:RNA polymerase sigma-70 factor (ECF subfamily)